MLYGTSPKKKKKREREREEFEMGFLSKDTETKMKEHDMEGNQETFWVPIPYCTWKNSKDVT